MSNQNRIDDLQKEHGELLSKCDKLEDRLREECAARRKVEAELSKLRQLQSLSQFFEV